MSTGQLLSFLDADDRLEFRQDRLAGGLIQVQSRSLCDCHTSYFWSPELSAEALRRDFRHASTFWREALPAHISGWLFRRELWHRVGEFSSGLRYSEDMDWFSQARIFPCGDSRCPTC